MTPLERAARSVCAASLSGFCNSVGGSLGCRVGRGEEFNGSNCAATREQLWLTEHWSQAHAVILSIREPSEAMNEAARRADSFDESIWHAMIDALLEEGQ